MPSVLYASVVSFRARWTIWDSIFGPARSAGMSLGGGTGLAGSSSFGTSLLASVLLFPLRPTSAIAPEATGRDSSLPLPKASGGIPSFLPDKTGRDSGSDFGSDSGRDSGSDCSAATSKRYSQILTFFQPRELLVQ